MKCEEQKEEEEKETVKLEDRAGKKVSQGYLSGKEDMNPWTSLIESSEGPQIAEFPTFIQSICSRIWDTGTTGI